MDTLDNANTNPFAINANADIILQKEGLLLDLAKQNGATTNGKRSADDEFNCDDDMGPETDIDAIDDVLMSPSCNNHFSDKEEEKATLETEHIKHDSVKLTREEVPTPPADLVHDTSGLDNVAESCEDSDDEWNYFKGDTADKENIPPSETDKEVSAITDNDAMSHLNPDAAEFVPLSPIRNESPAIQALMDEPLIAQSPKRGTAQNVDIKVPDLQEFECEIKSRPSEINHSNEDGEKLSSEEVMNNLLNGKNIEEIEFHPVSTPIKAFKAEEFHFGPNATPFSTPAKFDSSEISTKAVFGDESTASYLEKGLDSSYICSELSKSQAIHNENDPMSTSFYHDKDDASDTNPFDLNKVHVLPEDIDDFLGKPAQENSNDFLGKLAEESVFNETISDLPEHNPADYELLVEDSKVLTAAENLLLEAFETHEHVKSPIQCDELQELIEISDDDDDAKSHVPPLQPASPMVPVLSPVMAQSPIPQAESPVMLAQSPLCSQSPIAAVPESPTALFVDNQQAEECLKSPSPDVSACERAPDVVLHLPPPIEAIKLSSPSPVPSNESPVPLAESPVPSDQTTTFVDIHTQDVIQSFNSPERLQDIVSPIEDITSSVKDSPLLASSPIANRIEDFITHEIATSVLETSLPCDDALSPQSKIETESIATMDVNSFLDRSLLPDVASPLSPNEREDTIIEALAKPELLQDLIVKSDVIAPEFPVQQEIITPTESVVKSVAQKKTVAAKPKVGVASSAASVKKSTPKAATAPAKPAAKSITKTTPTAKPLAKTPTTPVAASPKPITRPIAKAPITNGVAKAPVASTLIKATSATNATGTKPAVSKTARPATAPAKPPVKQATVPITSRPSTLINKSSTSTTTAKKTTTITSTVTNTKNTVKSTITAVKEPPKPRLATAMAPSTARPKSAPAAKPLKTPDTEKSIKEAANKQTASRTATKTVHKVEPKVPTTRTSLTKTTAVKATANSKKPQELVRNPTTKVKVTKPAPKETKVHENGVETEIHTVSSTTTIEEPQLIKDVSPIIENSQLLD